MPVTEEILTKEEIRFLKSHGIEFSDIYDGRGLRTGFSKIKAGEEGCDVILGNRCTSPSRHRLKSRGGHCIQCKPASLAFVKRENMEGHVYLASASKGKIIKVGFTNSIFGREVSLNKQSYGCKKDWEILCSVVVKNGGQLERSALALFSAHAKSFLYEKVDGSHFSNETFEYDEVKAAYKFAKWVEARQISALIWHSTRKEWFVTKILSEF